MPIIVLSLLITVALIVHAIRTGQDKFWIWILIIAPGVGGLAYAAAILLPQFFGSRTAQLAGQKIRDKLDPERAVREARQALDMADTAHNRMRLADALILRGDARDAAQLYEEALNGVFADDPAILFKLGHARLEMGRAKDALDLFDRSKTASNLGLTPDQELLVARAFADTGQTEKSLELLKTLVPRFSGEEARCFYARTLADSGRLAEAREVIKEVLKREQRAPAYQRKAEKVWYDWARSQTY
jgi:hypothetical protein